MRSVDIRTCAWCLFLGKNEIIMIGKYDQDLHRMGFVSEATTLIVIGMVAVEKEA